MARGVLSEEAVVKFLGDVLWGVAAGIGLKIGWGAAGMIIEWASKAVQN